jgi:hypothetical protein
MDATAQIFVNVYDGQRTRFTSDMRWMVRLSDGRQLSARDTETYTGMSGSQRVFNVSYFDNAIFDSYTVVVSAKGFDDTGWFPVRVHPGVLAHVELMALPHDGGVNFSNAGWDQLQRRPSVARMFTNCYADAQLARNNYREVIEERGAPLACFLNITTAMMQMTLPSQRPALEYYWNIGWPQGDATTSGWMDQLDGVFHPDRFFCYVEQAFLDDVRKACTQGSFEQEPNPSAWGHSGATESYKQTQFDVANVQLTFHGGDTAQFKQTDGSTVSCIKIEPDIDYYKDLASHALLEVIPNKLSHGLTDPRVAYQLRWMAGKRAGLPEFDPLFTVA